MAAEINYHLNKFAQCRFIEKLRRLNRAGLNLIPKQMTSRKKIVPWAV